MVRRLNGPKFRNARAAAARGGKLTPMGYHSQDNRDAAEREARTVDTPECECAAEEIEQSSSVLAWPLCDSDRQLT